MHGYRSFLMLGGDSPADLMSLTEGGYELSDSTWGFQQGVDAKGRATTRVYGGLIHVVLPQLPPDEIAQWQLNPRMRKDGVVVLLDYENVPIQKLKFENAICSEMVVDYIMKTESYCQTRIAIQAERLMVDDGLPYKNEWNEE